MSLGQLGIDEWLVKHLLSDGSLLILQNVKYKKKSATKWNSKVAICPTLKIQIKSNQNSLFFFIHPTEAILMLGFFLFSQMILLFIVSITVCVMSVSSHHPLIWQLYGSSNTGILHQQFLGFWVHRTHMASFYAYPHIECLWAGIFFNPTSLKSHIKNK